MSKYEITAQFNVQAKPGSAKRAIDQIKREIKSPKINLEVANGAKAARDIKGVANATRDLAKEAKATESNVASMSKMFGSALKNVLRYDIARRVFYSFAGAIEQGVKDAISFEREMVKIAQVSGQTMQQLKGLERTVGGLSTNLGVSSSSLIRVGLILKQTGLSVKDTQIAMSALAKTELAPTFDNIADTAETAVAAMRQFGLQASALEGLLGKINTVAANFAVEASDIGVAIKRAGGAFKAAGGQVEELISLFTSVRATTRETAETIATGFRTIFTRLQRPTTIKFLRQFGIELTDLNGKFIGPYEAVGRLSNALANLDSQDLRFSAIVEQLGGFRQVSKVIPLIQQFGTAQAAYNAQLKASDSLSKDAETAQQSLAVQMSKLTEEVKELFREVADSTSFQALAATALTFAKAITAVGKALAPVIPMVTALFAIRGGAFLGGALKRGGLGGLNAALGRTDGRNNVDLFARGGKVHKFSNGGWVPGTGNSDTVPALLEPGEFVLRKSAAQAFGPALNGINKYRKGGPVLGKATYKKTYDGDSYNIDATPLGTPYSITTRLMHWDAPELPKSKAEEDLWKKKNPKINIEDPEKGHPGYRARAIAQKHMKKGKHFNAMFFDANGDPYGYDSFGRRPLFKDDNLVSKLSSAGLGKPMNKGGRVPALLTPGEFVVNKSTAQSIGYSKLGAMNRFNKGGPVGNVAALGGAAMSGIGSGLYDTVLIQSFFASLSSLGQQAGLLSGTFGDIVTEFGGALAQLKGITTGISSIAQALPEGSRIGNAARNVSEFGLFAAKDADKFRKKREAIATREAKRSELTTNLADVKSRREAMLASVRDGSFIGNEGNEAKKLKAYDKEIAKIEEKIKTENRSLGQHKAHQKQHEKTIASSKRMTQAFEIGAAVVVQAGEMLTQNAMKAIEAGDFRGRSAQAAVGGGLAGAAQGAMIGAQFGMKAGIWGALAAGVAGATMAFIEAEKRIKQVKFAQSLERTKKSLEDFQKGQISAQQGFNKLAVELKKNEALLDDLDVSDRQKSFDASSAAAETFLKGFGKSARNLEEFDQNVMKQTRTAREMGLLSYQQIRSIRKEVEERTESERKLREYNEAQRAATQELLKLKGISNVIGELSSDLKQSSRITGSIRNIGSGIGSVGSASRIFEGSPRSQGGISRFNASIRRIGSSSAGRFAGLNELSADVVSGAGIQRNLEDAITRAGSVSPTGDTRVQDVIIENLKNALEIEGTPLTKTIEDRLDKALTGVEIEDLDKDKSKITDAINNVIGGNIETFKEFSTLVDQRNDFLKTSLNELYQLETSYIAALRKYQDAVTNAEQNFSKNTQVGLGETDKSVQDRFFRRLDQIGKAGGINVPQGLEVNLKSVSSVGAALAKVQERLIQNEKDKLAIDKDPTDTKRSRELLEEGKKLTRQFTTLKNILNEYGNSQQRLVRLNQDLARAQQREKTLKDAADSIIFGTASESNEAAKLVNSITKALSEGTVMGIAPELRMAVVDAFKSGQFGQQGIDILNRDRAARLGQAGVGNTNVLAMASKAVTEVSQEIKAIEDVAAAAFNELSKVEKGRVDSMASAIETENTNFLNRLEQLFKDEQARTTQLDIDDQQRQVDKLQKILDAVKSGNISQEAFTALTNKSVMQEYESYKKMIERLDFLPKVADASIKSREGFTGLLSYDIKDRNIAGFVETQSGNVINNQTLQDRIRTAPDRIKNPETVKIAIENAKLLQKIMQLSGMTQLTLGGSLKDAGFSGERKEDLLENVGNILGQDSSAFDGFRNAVNKAFVENDAVDEAIFDIAKAFRQAYADQVTSIQDIGERNPVFAELRTIPKDLKDLISNSGLKGTINGLESEAAQATSALQALKNKLESITGVSESQRQSQVKAEEISKKKIEAETRQQREIERQSAASVPTASRFTGSINSPEQRAAFNEAQGIAENKARDAAARAERKAKAEAAARASSTGKTTTIDISSLIEEAKKLGVINADGEGPGGVWGKDVLNPNLMKEAIQAGKASNQETANKAIERMEQSASNGQSLSVHDHHAVPILQEILLTLKGQGQTGAAGAGGSTTNFTQIDTTGLDASINNFSSAVSDLERIMSGPIKMEVAGELNVNVNLTGAEVLQESESAFAQMAGRKVTEGINNFIRNGLRNSSIAIKGDWTA